MLMVIGVTAFSPLRNYVTFEGLIRTVEGARHSPWSLPVFYGLFILAVLGLPITVFPIAGGVLFGFWVALPLNIAACTIGATVAFVITRLFARDAVARMLQGKLKALDRLAGTEGIRTVFVLRLLGVPPFIIANYALGLSAIRLKHYVIGTLLGIAPWLALITFASHALWEAILVGGKKGFTMALMKIMGPMTLLSVGIVGTMAVVYWIKNKRAAKLSAAKNDSYSNL